MLDSLYHQSYPLYRVIVVDDGSTDSTLKVLNNYTTKVSNLTIVKLKDRGFSAVATPLLSETWNAGLDLIKEVDYDFLFMSGGDTLYPSNYVASILQYFNDYPKFGILGGFFSKEKISSSHARGPGRLIRVKIMDAMGKYPFSYAWESYMIGVAWYLNYTVSHIPTLTFTLQRPSGGKTNRAIYEYRHGIGMKEMGYHPLMAISRCIRVAISNRSLKTGIYMAAGYIKGQSEKKDIDKKYQQCVRKVQFLNIVSKSTGFSH